MTFPTPGQEKQMLFDVAKLESYLSGTPVATARNSMMDMCCHVKALLAEVELLRSTVDEVQEKRIEAAIEGTEWKGKALKCFAEIEKLKISNS